MANDKLREAFAVRLARFRGNLTDAEFDQLVTDMVATSERFKDIDGLKFNRTDIDTTR